MSDLTGRWSAEAFAGAEAVPVWTRPTAPRFTPRTPDRAASFSAWSSEPGAAPAPDPDAAQAEIYAMGFNEGHAAALASLDQDNEAIDRLAAALASVAPEPPTDLARLLAETVSRLVRQVVGEVAIDADLLVERTGAVAAMVCDEGASMRLRLHPADMARIDGARPDLVLLADPALPEGSVVAETQSGWIEDGPAIRLEKLRGLLDQMGCRR